MRRGRAIQPLHALPRSLECELFLHTLDSKG